MTELKETIPIGCDHAGYILKEIIKRKIETMGMNVKDYGTYSEESMDYPDPIHPLASAIEKGKYKRGVILCGSGIGASMVANKYPHVRAALCWNSEITQLARLHNNANVLSLPARFISAEQAEEMVEIFLKTEFEGGRHERRVRKISDNILL